MQKMEGKGIGNEAQGSLAAMLGGFIKTHAKSELFLLTPGGYVNLTPEQGQALLSGVPFFHCRTCSLGPSWKSQLHRSYGSGGTAFPGGIKCRRKKWGLVYIDRQAPIGAI